jgi:hypothetical protein
MRIKPKTNINWRTQLNLSKLCTYTKAWEREKRRRKRTNRRRTTAQMTTCDTLKDFLPPFVSGEYAIDLFLPSYVPLRTAQIGWGRRYAYICVACLGQLYRFINIIIMQITKTVLRAYEYYKKTMMQIWKHPPKQPLIFRSQMVKMKFDCT